MSQFTLTEMTETLSKNNERGLVDLHSHVMDIITTCTDGSVSDNGCGATLV